MTYECTQCSFVTQHSAGALERHMASHMAKEDRPFACPICQKRFGRADHLKEHERAHQRTKDAFPCRFPGCKRGFRYRSNMKRHMRSKHPALPMKPAPLRSFSSSSSSSCSPCSSSASSD